jgi:hypothetical protein
MVQGHVTNALMPNTAFEIVTAWSKLQDYMLEHLGNLMVDSPVFPPVMPNEANAMEIRTQNLMYIPAAYVLLFLNSRG